MARRKCNRDRLRDLTGPDLNPRRRHHRVPRISPYLPYLPLSPLGAAIVAYLNPSFTEWYSRDASGRSRLEADAVPGELALLDGWEAGDAPPVAESRVVRLDSECRLAAFEPQVCPSSLLLLQALLAAPPASWKKHSLPALARQVRKLLSEANARMQERQSLARLTTWGNTAAPPRAAGERPAAETTLYTTAREVVTPTGTLSDKETELVECFEAVQRWQQQRMALAPAAGAALLCAPLAASAAAAAVTEGGEEHIARMQRFVIGASPSEHDGRIAFLLAFGSAVELEVSSGDEGEKVQLGSPIAHLGSQLHRRSIVAVGDAQRALLRRCRRASTRPAHRQGA